MPNEFRPPTISFAPNLRDTGGYATCGEALVESEVHVRHAAQRRRSLHDRVCHAAGNHL